MNFTNPNIRDNRTAFIIRTCRRCCCCCWCTSMLNILYSLQKRNCQQYKVLFMFADSSVLHKTPPEFNTRLLTIFISYVVYYTVTLKQAYYMPFYIFASAKLGGCYCIETIFFSRRFVGRRYCFRLFFLSCFPGYFNIYNCLSFVLRNQTHKYTSQTGPNVLRRMYPYSINLVSVLHLLFTHFAEWSRL